MKMTIHHHSICYYIKLVWHSIFISLCDFTVWCLAHGHQPSQTKLYHNHGNPGGTQSRTKLIIYREIVVGVVTVTAVVTIVIVLAVILMVMPVSSYYHHVITGIIVAFIVYSSLSIHTDTCVLITAKHCKIGLFTALNMDGEGALCSRGVR
jgi:hypothetical protein